jgi:hypothetical protein
MPCGSEVVVGQRRHVTFDPKLEIEHGYSRWKYIDENNPYMGFMETNEMSGKRGNFNTPSS